MSARILHPGFSRRLPVSWRETDWAPNIRVRRSPRNRKRLENLQPTFSVLEVHTPQPGTPAISQKDSFHKRVSLFPAFKPKLSRDKRIEPS
jgi:hypothetical protein